MFASRIKELQLWFARNRLAIRGWNFIIERKKERIILNFRWRIWWFWSKQLPYHYSRTLVLLHYLGRITKSGLDFELTIVALTKKSSVTITRRECNIFSEKPFPNRRKSLRDNKKDPKPSKDVNIKLIQSLSKLIPNHNQILFFHLLAYSLFWVFSDSPKYLVHFNQKVFSKNHAN